MNGGAEDADAAASISPHSQQRTLTCRTRHSVATMDARCCYQHPLPAACHRGRVTADTLYIKPRL